MNKNQTWVIASIVAIFDKMSEGRLHTLTVSEKRGIKATWDTDKVCQNTINNRECNAPGVYTYHSKLLIVEYCKKCGGGKILYKSGNNHMFQTTKQAETPCKP